MTGETSIGESIITENTGDQGWAGTHIIVTDDQITVETTEQSTIDLILGMSMASIRETGEYTFLYHLSYIRINQIKEIPCVTNNTHFQSG